jgi:hypothetical protein
VSDYAPIHFRYKRHCERLGRPQCGDDELLRLTADCQRLERSGRYFGNAIDIVARFTSDEDPVSHKYQLPTCLANHDDIWPVT